MKRKEIDAIKAEALRLADELERDLCEYHCDAVALVLRRLHAENETLRAGYDAARLEIESLKAQSEGAQQPDTAYAALPDAPTASYAMVDAYLKAQREAVEEADRFGRPNIGGLHTNTVREACRAGLNAALEADRASHGQAPAPAAVAGPVVNRATVIEWLDANDIEVTDRQMDGLFHSAAITPQPAPHPVDEFQPCPSCFGKGVEGDADDYGRTIDVTCGECNGSGRAQATAQPAPQLPERDASIPAEQQGLFRKFDVRRVDGSDQSGGKHHGCTYFVLDLDHDPHARKALITYADACESTHPDLAADLRAKWGARPEVQPAPQQEATDALARAEYYIDNPSAWSSFDQRISDDISAVTEALRAARAAPKPQQEAQHLAQALTDPENQPNQYSVEFGMSGHQMYFKIGNQLFRLAYEPDEQEEFEFMKRMLVNAFAAFTPDVKSAPQPSPASQGDALDAEQREMDAGHAAIYRWMLNHVADVLSVFDNWLADGEADMDELHDALAARAAHQEGEAP